MCVPAASNCWCANCCASTMTRATSDRSAAASAASPRPASGRPRTVRTRPCRPSRAASLQRSAEPVPCLSGLCARRSRGHFGSVVLHALGCSLSIRGAMQLALGLGLELVFLLALLGQFLLPLFVTVVGSCQCLLAGELGHPLYPKQRRT